MRRSLQRFVLLAMIVGSGSACYSYAPHAGPVVPGESVRARLDVEASVRRSELLGEATRSVEGRVLNVAPNGDLQIEVLLGRNVAAFPGEDRLTRTFELAPDEIVALERRQFSLIKTAALSAIGIAITSVAIQRAVTGGDDGGGSGPGRGFSLIFGSIPILGGS